MRSSGSVSLASSSLYVGDLDPDVTESMLFERFCPGAGSVLSVRVCRDKVSSCSLGYGYINFERHEDAERALDTMNFDLLNGKPMRLMWCQRDPSLRKSGVGNIFIKNLEKSINSQALLDIFSCFGNILSCRVACDENGSKGFGFVHFETQEAAEKAINRLNGMLINEQKVFVGHFKSRSEREAEMKEKAKEFTNLYIKNFGTEMDDQTLNEMFSKFGQTVSIRVMTDESRNSRGFGFVSFKTHSEAQKAVEELNGTEWRNKRLYVGRAQKKRQRQAELKHRFEQIKLERMAHYKGINLYVKNLSDSVDTERLHKEFSPYGTITSSKVMMVGGCSRGFGFVCFSSPEEATKAITEMNGRIIDSKPIYVALAQRKEERQAHLIHRYMTRMVMLQSESLQPNPTMNTYHPKPTSGYLMAPQNAFCSQAPPQWDMWGVGPQFSHTEAPATGVSDGLALVQYIHDDHNYHKFSRASAQPWPVQHLQHDVYVQGDESLTTPISAAENQKQILGNSLFPLVQVMVGPLASKITTMLLEKDISELFRLLQSHEYLILKVNEAIDILKSS